MLGAIMRRPVVGLCVLYGPSHISAIPSGDHSKIPAMGNVASTAWGLALPRAFLRSLPTAANALFLQISVTFGRPRLCPQAISGAELAISSMARLWGKTTGCPGALFALFNAGPLPRHPSFHGEALLEGFCSFVILWIYSSKPRKARRCFGPVRARHYGIARFLVEFVRLPDAHIGYLAFGWLTMGQLLCLPLIALGIWLLARTVNDVRS